MPPIDPDHPPFSVRVEAESWERAKELQKRLHDGGFAGICFPREYGGLGLDYAYQKAFNAECRCYEMPLILNTPSFTICAATILDVGSEDQKRERISAAIRSDQILVQLLSEPNGGSDLAGVITRADHVSASIGNGSLPPNAGTLIRLFHAETTELEVDTALAIAGTAGVVDEGGDLERLLDSGVRYLSRQTGSPGGGSSEMARNVIAERVLGFPREYAADRGVPFNQVKRNKS